METMKRTWPLTRETPEEYEGWLEDLETKGWHLVKVYFLGLRHRFVKGEPAKYRYCYDIQSRRDPEYEAIFGDLGWELLYRSCGSYVWRMGYTDKRPEAFTDVDSLIARNNKFISLYTALFVVNFSVIITTITNNFSIRGLLSMSIYTIIVILLFLGAFRLMKVNRRLKKDKLHKG